MELLRPLLADITADGLSLVGEVTAEELGLTEDDAVVLGPLAVSLDLTNVEGLVAVTGVLEGTIVRECVRCLKEYEDPLAFSVRAAFIPEPKSAPRHPKRVDPRKARAKGRGGRTRRGAGRSVSLSGQSVGTGSHVARTRDPVRADAAALQRRLLGALRAMWEKFE